MTAVAPVLRSRRTARLRSPGLVAVAVVFLVLVAVAAAFAPWVAPADPDATSLLDSLAPPGSPGYPLGADSTGRDTLSRLVWGARLSLLAPLAVVVVATVLGLALGLAAAWHGGWVDAVISRATDVVFAFPSLLLALLAVLVTGSGLTGPVLALSLAYAPFIARLSRAAAQQQLAEPYVDAYQTMGFPARALLLRHVLPNIAPTVAAQAALCFGYALIDLASLSFIGLGVQPPSADWGVMINESQDAILQGQPWSGLVPGIAVVLTVVSVTVIGEHASARAGRRDTDR